MLQAWPSPLFHLPSVQSKVGCRGGGGGGEGRGLRGFQPPVQGITNKRFPLFSGVYVIMLLMPSAHLN